MTTIGLVLSLGLLDVASATQSETWALVTAVQRGCLADVRHVETLESGRLQLEVVVAGGKLTRANVVEDTTGSPRFARCVIARLDDERFPDTPATTPLAFDWTITPKPSPPAPSAPPPAPAPAATPDVKPDPALTRLLARAPREVRAALTPTARFASHDNPFGFDFDAWHIWDRDGHHLAVFTGESGRADRWLYYRGDDQITLTDNDHDGVPDERSRETMDGESLKRTVVEVREGGLWRTSRLVDYEECRRSGNFRETTFLPSGKKKVKLSSCIVS